VDERSNPFSPTSVSPSDHLPGSRQAKPANSMPIRKDMLDGRSNLGLDARISGMLHFH
jgi:hypothetical protein